MSGRNEILITGGFVSTDAPTQHAVSTDAAKSLLAAHMYRDGVSEGQAVGMLITIETAAIRVGFGVAPVRATPLGHPVQPNTEPIVLNSWAQIKNFQYQSEVLATPADLNITPFFD
jgi:hypothetical protein